MSTENMSTLVFLIFVISEILYNSTHAVGGLDEMLRLQWNESCCFSYFIFLEIWIEAKVFIKCELYFCFARLFNLQNKELVLLVM
jgi:hypothetical protein